MEWIHWSSRNHFEPCNLSTIWTSSCLEELSEIGVLDICEEVTEVSEANGKLSTVLCHNNRFDTTQSFLQFVFYCRYQAGKLPSLIIFITSMRAEEVEDVSGYVTKAERSNMQEIWDEVSENKSIHGRLWSFGIRSLRFRECGLYEASDLLLGDHLNEKSDTVKWIDVSIPHKRNRHLINHKLLQEIAKHNLDSEEIFEDNLIHTFYPQRPANLERVCLWIMNL